MKKQHFAGIFSAGILSLGLAGTANAALLSRLGGQAVYDTDLDITWLADANLAASNTFGATGIAADGTMNWITANSWITNMNSANYLGFSDWRLPETLVPDSGCDNSVLYSSGYNCSGSEMGHLFYTEFGAVAAPGSNLSNSGDPIEVAKFTHIQQGVGAFYWSATELIPDYPYIFNFNLGVQDANFKLNNNKKYAWAVRTGDVSAVPLPAAVWLFGSGLIGLLGVARYRY